MDNIVPQDIPQRKCNKCSEKAGEPVFYPATTEYFYVNKRIKSNGGLLAICKRCHDEKSRRYYKAHRDQLVAHQRQYYQDHIEECHVAVRQYHDTHREAINAHAKIYHQEHREENNERSHLYYERTKQTEHTRLIRRAASHRRRAAEKSVAGNHNTKQIEEQLKRQKHRCYYAACGFSKFPRIKEKGKWKYLYEVEHTFPISRVAGTDIPANDMGYIVLCCKECNIKKLAKFPWEWPEGGRLLESHSEYII